MHGYRAWSIVNVETLYTPARVTMPVLYREVLFFGQRAAARYKTGSP
jgi:hypothetical protein